jgi:hypothetical protein
VKAHLAGNITGGRDGLLFPAAGDPTKHLAPATLYRVFYKAREVAGRPDLRFHDLRHTGAVLAASTGATLAELMSRLGHSTAGAAMRYQHAAEDRDKVIAAALSDLVNRPARPRPEHQLQRRRLHAGRHVRRQPHRAARLIPGVSHVSVPTTPTGSRWQPRPPARCRSPGPRSRPPSGTWCFGVRPLVARGSVVHADTDHRLGA